MEDEAENKKILENFLREVGEKFKVARTQGLGISQAKLGEDAPLLLGKSQQVRVAKLEKGQGSAATVFAVLKHLYSRGVNINYLFGEEESILRISDQASLYPENITDYLEDMLVSTGKAKAILSDAVANTKRVRDYVDKTIELARANTKTKPEDR